MPTQSEIDKDYRRLKVLLEATDSFVLTFALYRDIREQRENAAKLKDLLDLPITEVELKGDNLNPVYTFLDLPGEPRQALFYTFLGSSLPEGESDFDKFAGYVNIQREAFTDAPHAVVLWLREEQLVRLMRRAPDFWAWRSGVFDVRGELQPNSTTYRELEEVDAFERGELEHQVALYREILKGQLERDEPDLAYIARTRLRLIDALYRLGIYEAAATEAQDVILLAEILENDAIKARGINNLALMYDEMSQYDEAELLYRKSLEMTEEVSGRESPDYTSMLNNLANLLSKRGHYDEAESKLREALKIDERISGTEHSDHISSLHNLAELLKNRHNYDEAERLFHKTIDITEKTQGVENPLYVASVSNLAGLLVRMSRYDEAELLYRKALEIEARKLGKQHPNYANKLNNLTKLLWDTGRYEEAKTSCHEALEICRERLGPDHPDTRMIAANYQFLLEQLEQPSTPSTSG